MNHLKWPACSNPCKICGEAPVRDYGLEFPELVDDNGRTPIICSQCVLRKLTEVTYAWRE